MESADMTKILAFDLDPNFQEVIKAALASFGYEPVIAADGYSVLPLAQQHKPSLVVLDYQLPVADGFEILSRVRAVPEFASMPIIFASKTPKFEIEMAIMGAPGVAYIDRPLDARQLKDAIEGLIGKPVAAPAAAAPMVIPPPGAPLGDMPGAPPAFSGEADLDGARDGVIDLD